MELPGHLLRTYRRYKSQEKDLLQWISDNSTLSQATTPDALSTRLGSRARISTRKITQEQVTPTNTPLNITNAAGTHTDDQRKSCMTLLEILPHARNIADNPKVKSVPDSIVKSLQSVLELRRRCFSWFRQNTAQTDEETREKNRKHAYPINLLLRAIEILTQKLPQTHLRNESESSIARQEHSFSKPDNLYEVLNVDESQSEVAEVETQYIEPVHSKNIKIDTAKSLSSEDARYDEYVLAMYCFFEDVHEIEDFVLMELARYSLDRQNADYLGFLLEIASEMVWKMHTNLEKTLDRDRKLAHLFYYQTLDAVSAGDRELSPLERMKFCLQVVAANPDKELPTVEEFISNVDYFSADSNTQYVMELSFAQMLFRTSLLPDLADYEPFALDKGTQATIDNVARIEKMDKESKEVNSMLGLRLGWAFDTRLSLLTRCVLGNTIVEPLQRFLDDIEASSKSAARQIKFCRMPVNHSEPMAIYLETYGKHLECLAGPGASLGDSITNRPRLQSYLANHPRMVLYNECICRRNFGERKLTCWEYSSISKLTVQLWNVLREKSYLDESWLDVDYLVQILGEEIVYMGERPKLRDSSEGVFLKKVSYLCGSASEEYPTAEIPAFVNSHNINVDARLRSRVRPMQVCFPLNVLLARTIHTELHKDASVVEDVELMLTALDVPTALNKRPATVEMNGLGQLLNRAELWKLVDKGPGLQPTQLLAVMRDRLRRECASFDFDFIAMETACGVLIQQITTALYSSGFKSESFLRNGVEGASTSLNKVYFLLLSFVHFQDRRVFETAAAVFKDWLGRYGDVGLRDIQKKDKVLSTPKSVEPGIANMVKDIVKRRGLLEGVFSQEQLSQLGDVEVTGKIEDQIQDAWKAHKNRER